MKYSKKILLALCAAPVVLLTACGGSDSDDFDDRVDLADPQLRFVHAIPGGPNVTLTRNDVDEPNATNVGYKYASQYYDVSTRQYDLKLKLAGTNTQVGSLPTFSADRGDKYTVVALPGSGSADMLFLTDPYDKGITSNNARVRVVNASFNAQNIDVYIVKPGTDLATVAPAFPAIAFKAAHPASGANSIDMEGGTYDIRVTTAGTKNVIFNNTVDLARNADWLLLTIPSSGIGALTPNDIRVLVAKSDDAAKATIELQDQP